MDERAARLGPPDLELAGFRLWVHGYQFPEVVDAWDGNWLRVTAHCAASGSSVWASGALLDTVGRLEFGRGLAALHATLRGEAVLASLEPNVVVRAAAADRTGHITVRVELSPDRLTQEHAAQFDADQSYLPAVVAQCDALLERYPVRDAASRSV